MARRTAHLYLVDFNTGKEWAYYPGDELLDLGDKRDAIFDPVADQWWIKPYEGEFLTYRSFDAAFDLQVLATVSVSRSGIGAPSYGPLSDSNQSNNSSASLRIAVSPNGSFMVVGEPQDGPPFDDTLRLHLWDASIKGWSPTVTDEISPGSFPQDIAMSSNGDLIAALSASPWVKAWHPTTAGFGTAYSDPGSGSPGYYVETVEWHPSGTAVLWGGTGGSGGWEFTTGVGFGAAYGPYDGTGFNSFSVAKTIRFSPSGNHIAIHGGTSGLGTIPSLFDTVVPFDLVTGMGTAFTAPVSGEVDSGNSDTTPYGPPAITDTHMYAIITDGYPAAKLYRYPYGAGALSPGVLAASGAVPTNIFHTHPILISRTGKFMAWSDQENNDLINVYAIEADGSLTTIGTIAPDPDLGGLPSGHHALGWR